jgi:hypothetical protein
MLMVGLGVTLLGDCLFVRKKARLVLLGKGAVMNESVSGAFSRVGCMGLWGLAAIVISAEPSWAGMPVPAPLIGVTGPFGLLAAGVGYGGYLLFKRYRRRT